MEIYLVEEHHEVFLIWDQFVHDSNLPLHDATLIHIDAHPDMDLPDLAIDLKDRLAYRDVLDLVYDDLDIQTFITAAIYRGFFDQVVWLSPHMRKRTSGDTYIWSERRAASRLCMSTQPPTTADARKFNYQWTGLNHRCQIIGSKQIAQYLILITRPVLK